MNKLKKFGMGVCLSVICISLTGCNNASYKKAQQSLNEGDYVSARNILTVLSERNDSEVTQDDFNQCDYLEGMDYYNSGDYKNAYIIFNKIKNYSDAERLANESANKMIDNAQVGDICCFGFFEQDGDIENGEEPIEWLIIGLKDDNILLLSKDILQRCDFSTDGTTEWSESSLRDWLNNTFINAFSNDERKKIQKTITSKNTEDYVFCLSRSEANNIVKELGELQAKPSVFAKKEGFRTGQNWNSDEFKEYGRWWLRTKGPNDGVICVDANGSTGSWGSYYPTKNNLYSNPWDDIGVRPAIVINKNSIDNSSMNMIAFGADSDVSLEFDDPIDASNSSKKSRHKCAVCNGTGHVRYYYGSSDFEAYITGHDPYTIGKCTSCGGSGYIYDK